MSVGGYCLLESIIILGERACPTLKPLFSKGEGTFPLPFP